MDKSAAIRVLCEMFKTSCSGCNCSSKEDREARLLIAKTICNLVEEDQSPKPETKISLSEKDKILAFASVEPKVFGKLADHLGFSGNMFTRESVARIIYDNRIDEAYDFVMKSLQSK